MSDRRKITSFDCSAREIPVEDFPESGDIIVCRFPPSVNNGRGYCAGISAGPQSIRRMGKFSNFDDAYLYGCALAHAGYRR